MAEKEEIAELRAILERLTRQFAEMEARVGRLETRTEALRSELKAAVSNLEAKLEKFMEDLRSEPY
jgi:outer membrane murein-binding lipoprotein Lpp